MSSNIGTDPSAKQESHFSHSDIPQQEQRRPRGQLVEIQAKNKRNTFAKAGATTHQKGHAKASTQRSQAKRDSVNSPPEQD